jgi:hypothetical protein
MWSGGTRARTAVEYMNAVDMVRMEMPAMTFPFLCFHSRQDTMTDPEGSDQLYKCGPPFPPPPSWWRAVASQWRIKSMEMRRASGARIRICVNKMLCRWAVSPVVHTAGPA